MNELFEPGDPPPERVPEPREKAIDYDEDLETVDPAYRYVLRRPSAPSAGS